MIVLNDISINVAKIIARNAAANAAMEPRVQCVLLADTGRCANTRATVTAVLAIYGMECVIKYSYVLHIASRVLPLEIARHVRRDFTVPIEVRHAPV